ncbi:ABC transporter family substrate-binding protein [uncultured Corynebacterium sp.]|uniref:ABC transporter family substrate-binding protein n=1 Tax=uncultured Corynebacterium sp. TaxID=159447 RepID=UPI0028D6D941|nr:ABC transporter family substrate-binding protein [uncultured Corynebacterium sp.]
MKRSSVMSVVAVVAATGLMLGGCTANHTEVDYGPAATVEIKPNGDYNPLERDQIKDGGELTLPILEVPEQSNSLHGNAIVDGTTLWRWYNPQMTLADGDGTWHPNPAYLTNVNAEEVDGKTVVTYDINPDAVFNDGTPIDWRVFETMWKFNNAENPDVVANSTDGYDQIESVTAGESDKQAVVTYKQAYPWWQALFDRVLHPSVADAQTFNEGYLKNPHPEWGAGPYKVDQFDYNSGTVSFVPNEKWWGEKPKLDKVTYRQMESQATINAYQAGEVDAVEITNKDHLAVAKTVKDTTLRGTLRPSNYLVTLNAKTPTLEDVKVREAVFTGINRETLAQVRFNGMDYTENLPGSFALFQNQKGYQDNFGGLVTYDQDKSKQLLDEAGWTEGSDGIREKDGKKLTLRYVTFGDSQLVKSTAAAMQKMMKDIGVDLQVAERPSSDFSQVIAEREFDVLTSGFTSYDPYGVAYFKQVYASDSELNKSGTGTPEMDKKIAELQQLPTQEEQIERANELEKEALQQYGIMPYVNGPQLYATKNGLANYGSYAFALVPKENIGWAK